MSPNKQRLYVALYARGGARAQNTYHWAVIAGPKKEDQTSRGFKFHAKQVIEPPDGLRWVFEESEISLDATGMLLTRLTVGKISDISRVRTIMREAPVIQNREDWTCRIWVRDALALLDRDEEAMGTRTMEWESIFEAATSYCNRKKSEGRFSGGKSYDYDDTRPPTFNLMKNRETIP